jgi:flagellar hook assembly protein FlgD
VALRVYDVSGRHVTTLVDGFESAGRRTITWHGEDDTGQPVASGIYFYRLDAPEFSQVKKMILIE